MPRKFDGSRYAEVTDRIIEALQKGVAPWEKPWATSQPRNAETGRRYRGINRLLLDFSALERGYSSPGWLTYAAARRLGGHVRRGESGVMVIYYERRERRQGEQPAWDLETDQLYTYFAKHFFLFNLEQIDGCEALQESFGGLFASQPHEAVAEEILSRAPVKIEYGGDRAAYCPTTDRIILPDRSLFKTAASFFSVAYHELGHSTGHPSRLNRNFEGRFGDPTYAAEELIAEITAANLCSHAGLDVIGQSASYIDSWLQLLAGDCRAIFVAGREAQVATDLILGEWEPEVVPATAIGVDANKDGAVTVSL